MPASISARTPSQALNGLDPLVNIRLRRLLAPLVTSGAHAVILSTHMLEQVAATATGVPLLEEGALAHRWDRAGLAAARTSSGGTGAAFMAGLGHDQ